jgi:hypothetical protein
VHVTLRVAKRKKRDFPVFKGSGSGLVHALSAMDSAFPLTADAVQSTNKAYPGGSGFLSVFTTDASTILYSTYFGSSNLTLVQGIGLDPANNIYITGFAKGIDLPTTQQLFQSTLQGTSDLFVAKFGGISTPTIASLSATSGLVGTPLTISGLNFGTSQGTVTFNGVAATPTSWNPTSILVPVPAGATQGNVVVTAGGVASNGTNFTVLFGDVPIVFVQHAKKSAGTTTSAPLAFTLNNSAGNWVGVLVRASGTNQALTISDSNGNLYRQAVSVNETGGGNTLAMFYAENIAAGPKCRYSVGHRLCEPGAHHFGVFGYSLVQFAGHDYLRHRK